jgi:hypothetical protein
MVNCRKTIAFVLILPVIFLLTASAIFADSKEEASEQWLNSHSASALAPQSSSNDNDILKKAEADAKFENDPVRLKEARRDWPADAKTAPPGTVQTALPARASILLTQGFEGAFPPAPWSVVVNNHRSWHIESYFPYEASQHLVTFYDEVLDPQDEWLFSPPISLSGVTADIRVEFYWYMSYFWGVSPNDNYDLEVWISTDGGATFPTLLWDESAQGSFVSYDWYDASVSLSAYIGQTVVLGFRYVGADGAEGSFDYIVVTDDAPPELGPGNDCSDPEKVDLPADIPYSNVNMTCGRGDDYSFTCLDPYDGGEDIIYELTVTSTVTVDITLDPQGTSWTGMAVYPECPPGGVCIASANNGSSSLPYTMHGVMLDPGTYYLMIDTWPAPDCIPSFELTIETAAPSQPGDNCADPLKIDIPSLPYSDLGQTTCGRIDDYDATCLGSYDGGEDIIYEVTVLSPVTVDITLDPLGTDYTGIVIDDVCPPGSAGCIGSSTNFLTTPHTIFAVSLSPGTYYIMVDTWPAPDCIPTFDLHITESGAGPANDDWEDAEKVDDILDFPFCTAGGSVDGPSDDFCNDCANVWFCYTASCDGVAIVDLCGSGYDTKVAAYDGCGEPTLGNQLACNDDYCGLQSSIEFPVVAGNEYLIEVGGYLGASCNIGCGDISISCVVPCQVECPSGAGDEGEPCGDDTNGGCNSPIPVFRDITCGETVCGTGWFDGSLRDTDWYRLVLNGFYEITWTVQAEFEALIGPLGSNNPGSGDCADLTGSISPAGFTLECEELSVTTLLGPGTHFLFVAPLFGDLVFCEADYWASLTCVPVEADYCPASGGTCDEFISNVTVGSINNSSGCSNYADYTALSTAMTIGTPYPITVTNGPPTYSGDQCGIWVDWNLDSDFSDADEMIAVTGTPGTGPYTATITPPVGAVAAATTMRIRITWTGAVSPCGTTTYGEVEDYTIVVSTAPSNGASQMGLNPGQISSAMTRPAAPPGTIDIFVAGEVASGYSPADVNLSTLLINGSLPAVQPEVLESHPDYQGSVLRVGVDMAAFAGSYGILYNTTVQNYTVAGQFADATAFSISDDFDYLGHIAGDVNVDRSVNVLDLTYVIDRVFRGGAPYVDPIEADINADGTPGNVLDLTYLINHIFRGGPPPLELNQ